MTLYHFGNCFALAYVPYYLTYKYSGLSEYGAFWKCIQAGGVYMFTQLCKMLVLATFFPTTDTSMQAGMDFIGELLKSTVDLADLIGLHIVMTRVPGKGHTKVLVAGVGWATAELLLTRLLVLWVGARGVEFDWKYIQKSFDSNISLVQHVVTAMLVWLWLRTDLNRSLLPVVLVLLLVCCYKPLLLELVHHVMGPGPWIMLLIKAVITVCLGVMVLQLYIGLTTINST